MGQERSWLANLQRRAHELKRDAIALTIALRDARTPWYAKILLGLVVAHTFSPIDLIPDFIPVLGYLDDAIITPLGIALALKLIPPEVMDEARQQAESAVLSQRRWAWRGAALVIVIWLTVLLAIGIALTRVLGHPSGQ